MQFVQSHLSNPYLLLSFLRLRDVVVPAGGPDMYLEKKLRNKVGMTAEMVNFAFISSRTAAGEQDGVCQVAG